jgi:SAM-dependent methyltransferase
MKVFDGFARVYASGSYSNLSLAMVDILPKVMKKYRISANGTRKLLDVACGEGTFCVEMAKKGWVVTGVDQSEEMLRLARHRAEQEDIKLNFARQDMRFIDYANEFDIATCWFDSLNYLLTNSDLQSAFNSIYRSLKPNGWFLFDMNTIFGLAVEWQRNHCYVKQETADLLELHRTSFDFEKNLGCITITWFVKAGETWEKFEEKHVERGFTIAEIESSLQYAGFHVVDILSNLNPLTPLTKTSGRAWFLAHK